MRKYTPFLKILIFSLLFISIFVGTSQIFKLKQLTKPWDMTNKVGGLRNEPRDTMDVMYFGSSHMYASVNPVVVWEEIGVPSYSFATRQQALWMSYYYMKEALKYQKPKVVVLDIFMSKQQEDYSEEAVTRTAVDMLPFSKNKIDLIRASVPKDQRASYYIDFIKYHSRWKELKDTDFDLSYLNNVDPLKGYVMLDKISVVEEREPLETVTTKKPLSEKSLEYLMKIIELSKEKGFELVFYKAPSHATREEKAYFNTVEDIATEYDIPFIDYNMRYEELDLNSQEDFYDKGHVNYKGSEKVTKHFAKFLQDTYNLPSQKDNPLYAGWEESVAYYNHEKEVRPLTLVEP